MEVWWTVVKMCWTSSKCAAQSVGSLWAAPHMVKSTAEFTLLSQTGWHQRNGGRREATPHLITSGSKAVQACATKSWKDLSFCLIIMPTPIWLVFVGKRWYQKEMCPLLPYQPEAQTSTKMLNNDSMYDYGHGCLMIARTSCQMIPSKDHPNQTNVPKFPKCARACVCASVHLHF